MCPSAARPLPRERRGAGRPEPRGPVFPTGSGCRGVGGGCHGDGRARTSQSARSCGSGSPLGCGAGPGGRGARQGCCAAASPRGPAPRDLATRRLAPPRLKGGAALGPARPPARRWEGCCGHGGAARREEGALSPLSAPTPCAPSRSAGRAAHAHWGRGGRGGADVIHGHPPHPPGEGRRPPGLHGTDAPTDQGGGTGARPGHARGGVPRGAAAARGGRAWAPHR